MNGKFTCWFSNRWVVMAARLILAVTFLYAGIEKLRDPLAFADSIASFQILPDALINLVALSLPVLEIFLGLMLLTDYEAGLAALTTLILMAVFIVALISALVRGLEVDCGCFGSSEPSVWQMYLTIGRDLLFGAMAWLVLVTDFKKQPTPENEA